MSDERVAFMKSVNGSSGLADEDMDVSFPMHQNDLPLRSQSVSRPVAVSAPASPVPSLLSASPPKVSTMSHLWRTFFVFLFLISFVFFMTLLQVYIDNEALSYYYDVRDADAWAVFNSSMFQVANDPHLLEMFPTILLSSKYGGGGNQGALPANLSAWSNSNKSALLLDDLIFRSMKLHYKDVKKVADIMCGAFVVVTLAFLLILPYFDAFKTTVKRKMRSKGRRLLSPNSSLDNRNSNSNLHSSHAIDTQNGQKLSISQTHLNIESERETSPSPLPALGPRAASASASPSPALPGLTSPISIFLFPARYIHGLVFVRRLLFIVGLNYLFRGFVVALTILPQENAECVPVLRESFWPVVGGAIQMILGSETACHDFIYSGHTSISTILCWFWIIYSSHALFHPRRYYLDLNLQPGETARLYKKKKRSKSSVAIIWIIRLLSLTYLISVAVCLVVSRIHYTIDVAIGLLVGTLFFWFWHALITLFYYFQFKSHILESHASQFTTMNQKSPEMEERRLRANMEIRDVLVPIKRSNLAIRFVGWVDGYDLYVNDNIGHVGSTMHPRRADEVEAQDETFSTITEALNSIQDPLQKV